MARTRRRAPKKDWKPAFLLELSQRGNVALACVKSKIGRQTAYDARAADIAFAVAWKEAVEFSTELMEAEARRRAVEGTLRPVYQGKKLVGKVREYSDTMMIFLLKAHKPEKYRDRHQVEHTGSVAQVHVYLPQKDAADTKPPA